jgi:CheY-like chemotaxis protein
MKTLPPVKSNGSLGAHKPLAVLIVDDSEVARESLRTFVAAQAGLRVVAVVASGLDAMSCLYWETVDLVITDLNMPDMDGLNLTRRIRALPRPSRVIIISAQNTLSCRDAAREAGADGFVTKSEVGQSLMPQVARIRSLIQK